MLAARLDALVSGDSGGEALASYDKRVRESWIHEEPWASDFHQSFERGL
jgi:hypothetical protein